MNLEKLTQIYNTLNLIETKGQSSKLMTSCLFLFEEFFKELNQNNHPEVGGINDSK